MKPRTPPVCRKTPFRLNTDRKSLIVSAIAFVVSSTAIYAGYSKNMSVLKECHASVKRYVTAEYSEVSTSIDMEGNVSTSTDFWSEPASEVYSTLKINELPEYPPMPSKWLEMRRDYGFDNFQEHTDTNLKIVTGNTSFSEPIGDTKKCLDKLNQVIIVKTWYGISYGSEWL